jgi:hypothetical protein
MWRMRLASSCRHVRTATPIREINSLRGRFIRVSEDPVEPGGPPPCWGLRVRPGPAGYALCSSHPVRGSQDPPSAAGRAAAAAAALAMKDCGDCEGARPAAAAGDDMAARAAASD